jgi:hypothetical protein
MTEDRVFSKVTPTILASLKEIADDLNVLTGDDCESYSRDEAPHPRHSLPEVVIKPTSTLINIIFQSLHAAPEPGFPAEQCRFTAASLFAWKK